MRKNRGRSSFATRADPETEGTGDVNAGSSFAPTLDPKTDGLGQPLEPATLYFIQDARSCVGNCGSWWAPKGAGYVCAIDDAGQYTGEYCVSGLRTTDVPWPVNYVFERTVRHVRVDNQAFSRHRYKAGPL
jgi:hypothetical protein